MLVRPISKAMLTSVKLVARDDEAILFFIVVSIARAQNCQFTGSGSGLSSSVTKG